MYIFLLALHNLLRWIVIILLLVNIYKLFSSAAGNKISASKWLLIATHTTFLIGLYLYFTGGSGYVYFQQYGADAVMKNPAYRFWAVEHISGMIASVIFITIGHISLKKSGNQKRTAILYLIAFIIILAVVPWPFRADVARPLLRSFH